MSAENIKYLPYINGNTSKGLTNSTFPVHQYVFMFFFTRGNCEKFFFTHTNKKLGVLPLSHMANIDAFAMHLCRKCSIAVVANRVVYKTLTETF